MAVKTCKEGGKLEITAAQPEFYSPRAWLSSTVSVLGPARNTRSPRSYIREARGLLRLALSACRDRRGARGGQEALLQRRGQRGLGRGMVSGTLVYAVAATLSVGKKQTPPEGQQ